MEAPPEVAKTIQKILEGLKRRGWDQEIVLHLGKVFYEYAGKYYDNAVRRFGVPSKLLLMSLWES